MEQMQSEQINELATALSKAQSKMTHASKDSTNPHFRNDYADLASVLSAVREPLTSNGLSVVQTTNNNVLVTTLLHSSGQWMRSYTPILSSKQDAQGFGSGMTYARRYALSAICGIAQDDDDANEASKPQTYPKAEPKPKVIPIDPFLTACESHFKRLGEQNFYSVLGVSGFENPREVKTEADKKAVLTALEAMK